MYNYMSNKSYPLCVKIEKDNNNILDYDGDYEISSSICLPKFDYGFQHWMHQNKNKDTVIDNFEGKKKVYYILNEFEIVIDNHNESIYDESVKYFNFDTKDFDKENNDFYKLWEIINFFELIDKNNNFSSLSLSDDDSMSYYSISEYRKINNINNKNDKYVVVGDSKKLPSNITNSKSIPTKGEFDLIITDKSVVIKPENILEQFSYKTIFNEIYNAITLQKKGGNYICKIYESFTIPIIKMISLLTNVYEEVYMIKPLTSRLLNSEVYVVCKNFSLNDKQRKDCLVKIKNIIDAFDSLNEKTHIVNIFTEHNPDWKFKISLAVFNIIVSNEKLKNMNQVITYIEGSNFYGDTYRINRAKQINSSKYWNDTFLSKKQKNMKELLNIGLSYSENRKKEYMKVIIDTNKISKINKKNDKDYKIEKNEKNK